MISLADARVIGKYMNYSGIHSSTASIIYIQKGTSHSFPNHLNNSRLRQSRLFIVCGNLDRRKQIDSLQRNYCNNSAHHSYLDIQVCCCTRQSAIGNRKQYHNLVLCIYFLSYTAIGNRQSAIGNRLSAIGYRLSAIGYRLSAIGNRQSAIGNRQSEAIP